MFRDRWMLPVLAMSVVVFFQAPVDAEALGSAANGFQIAIKIEISGSRQQVYDGFVENVGQWWDAGHTYSGDSNNLYIEAEEKGWFGEHLPDGPSISPTSTTFSTWAVASTIPSRWRGR